MIVIKTRPGIFREKNSRPTFADEPLQCQVTVITAGFGIPGFLRSLVFGPVELPNNLLKAALPLNPVSAGEPSVSVFLRILLHSAQAWSGNFLRLLSQTFPFGNKPFIPHLINKYTKNRRVKSSFLPFFISLLINKSYEQK